MSYRRTNEPRPLEVEGSTAGATSHRDLDPWDGGGDLGEALLFEADIAELITLTANSSDQPIIEEVQVASVEALMDLARERSSQGHPREVTAVINGLPVARFMGRWMWDTRREFE